jgi:hypothetical protein
MLNLFSQSTFFNKKMNDYGLQSTIDSIRQLCKRYKERIIIEKNEQLLLACIPPIPPHFTFLLYFLSVSPIFFYIYKNNNKYINN